MTNVTSNRVAAAAAAAAVAAIGYGMAGPAARAAGYPSKPVTLVIPYKAGGSTETMGRIYSKALGAALGTRVIVRTRPGAGGAIGATEVAKKKPDGYTLLFAASVTLLWPPLTQKVEYTADSFTYIGQVTDYQMALIAKADAPFNTMKELVAYAKTHKLTYADQGAMQRAFIDYIGVREGVKWIGIPTKGGGEMVPFLLGGKVDFAWSGGVHQRYGNKMKVLLSFNKGRLAASPNAPSMSELYGVSMPSHALIAGPKGMNPAVVAKIAAAMKKATTDPQFVDLMENKLRFPIHFVGPKQLTADIAKTSEGLKQVVKATQK
jgi:tripartite-type tricarboxylate transporter receptor subunit TctC